jgi:methyl-accepting chemotaxis protein
MQVPVDEINRVMTGNRNWQKDGLGLSGETCLVGVDHAMRSVSRFLEQDPQGYLEMLEDLNVSSQAIDDIHRFGTTILAQTFDTEAARNALERREGTMIVDDYRGIKVLSSFAPLSVKGLDWAILSEMDLDEAYAPVNAFKRQILVWGSLSILLITMASLWLSSLFIQPVRRLINGTTRISNGEIDVLAASEASGEFAELADALGGMVDRLQSLARSSEEQGQRGAESPAP